ncbi:MULTISPECIES: transporter substrate-binding domain-containing protein [Arsenicicoccus]|uniref:transporter substrate-binding domain-containing protein n=1 Tax=Arsenicicoccus TaxID=267408 RepID=UPI00257C5BD0|nr:MULTISPECIES: transporter substrate-binding domain-containing protein [Arsenicicoccus]
MNAGRLPAGAGLLARSALAALVIAAVSACGVQVPTDPGRTLDRVRSERVLRVGATHAPPRVVATDPEGEPSGPEAELAQRYAAHLGARVEWTTDSEAALVEDLSDGEVDLVVAGLDATSPWAADVGLTRPYAESTDPGGQTRQHVLAVPAGENALLSDLERWLDSSAGGAS